MKYLYLFICLLISSACYAQKQNVYYLKNSGLRVASKDSADYIRVVSEPDSGSVLYNIFEYYPHGEKRMVAKSSKIDPVMLEGMCIMYYPNGKRKLVASYKKNMVNGSEYTYFPSGLLYTVKQYGRPDSVDKARKPVPRIILIKTCNDTTGKSVVTDGNGHYLDYDSKFKYVEEEGDVKEGKKDGEWKGKQPDSKFAFTEQFKDGKFISGKSTDKNGKEYNYKVEEKSAEFRGGINAFYNYLGSTIVYPTNARLHGIQGKVFVTFIVEKDGSLTDIKIVKSPSNDLSVETIRVLQLSPLWTPGMEHGMPARQQYTLPVSFTLSAN